jgi:hypothetical protein
LSKVQRVRWANYFKQGKMLADASKRPVLAGRKAMSDESEIGTVLANAPMIKKASGPYLGALIIVVSLCLAQPRPGILRFFVFALIAFAAAMQGWVSY